MPAVQISSGCFIASESLLRLLPLLLLSLAFTFSGVPHAGWLLLLAAIGAAGQFALLLLELGDGVLLFDNCRWNWCTRMPAGVSSTQTVTVRNNGGVPGLVMILELGCQAPAESRQLALALPLLSCEQRRRLLLALRYSEGRG